MAYCMTVVVEQSIDQFHKFPSPDLVSQPQVNRMTRELRKQGFNEIALCGSKQQNQKL